MHLRESLRRRHTGWCPLHPSTSRATEFLFPAHLHKYINSHHIFSPPCQIRATGVQASPSRAEEEKSKNNKFQKRHTTAAAISQQSAGGRVKRAAPLSVARGSTGWRRRSQTSPQTIGIDRSKRKERKTRGQAGAKRQKGKNKTKKEEEKGKATIAC